MVDWVLIPARARPGHHAAEAAGRRRSEDHPRRLLVQTCRCWCRLTRPVYGRGPVYAAIKGGAAMSVTVRMDMATKKAIATIPDHAWTTIEYTDVVSDEATACWVSRAKVAGVPFTAFAAQKKASRCRADSWSVGSRASTPTRTRPLTRTPCSMYGGSTLSSPPAQDPGHRRHGQGPPRPRHDREAPRRPHTSALAPLPSGAFNAEAAWLVLAANAFNLNARRRSQPATSPCTAQLRHPSWGPAPSLAVGDPLGPRSSTGSNTCHPAPRPDHPAAPRA